MPCTSAPAKSSRCRWNRWSRCRCAQAWRTTPWRASCLEPDQPRLYTDLADWFHLLTAPEEYAEEAAFYFEALVQAAGGRLPRTLLELGSGGGNNAWHYKRRVDAVTLVDLSEGMLSLSRRINPECEHAQ